MVCAYPKSAKRRISFSAHKCNITEGATQAQTQGFVRAVTTVRAPPLLPVARASRGEGNEGKKVML